MTKNAQPVIDAIEAAFSGVQLQDGISLQEAIVLDNYGTEAELRRVRSQGEVGDWRCIPDETIASYSASLAFLDPKLMRFYLPAFMRFALRHYQRSDSASIDYTIYPLDCSPGSDSKSVDFAFEGTTEQQRALLGKAFDSTELRAKLDSFHTCQAAKFSLLTETQRDAVRGLLEFMAFQAVGRVDDRVARRALERVWRKIDDSSQRGAPPSSGASTRPGNSGVIEGPPSVI